MDSSSDESSNMSVHDIDDEEDRMMYEKAERIHNRRKIRNSTLQNACFEAFLHHADRFVSIYEENHELNTFHQLPSQLKLKFLDFILSKNIPKLLGQLKTVAKAENATDDSQDLSIKTDDSELRCAFLKMILEKQPLKILDLEKIITIYMPNEYIKYMNDSKSPLVLQMVAQVVADSPDLEEFKCNLIVSRANLVTFGSLTLLDQALTFRKLRVLELRGTADRIDDLGLMTITYHLPHLTTLTISLDKSVTRFGLSSCLSTMAKLREFSFIVIETSHYDRDHGRSFDFSSVNCEKTREIFEWCAEDVAQLQEISAYGSWKGFLGCKYQIPSADFLIFAEPSTCRVNRRVSQLRTVHATGRLPSAQFPDLQILKFSGPISKRDDFLARCLLFTKLTVLELFKISRKKAVLVLKSCGRGLTRLALRTSNWSRVDDCLILALCPKLAFLSNSGRYEPDPAESNGPLCPAMATPMEHLVEVELNFLHGPAPANCLQLMLASPVIESLNIANLEISALDLVALSEVGGPTLKSYYLHIYVSKKVCTVNDLERMAMNVVGHSENLENFYIVHDSNSSYFDCWDEKVWKFFKINYFYHFYDILFNGYPYSILKTIP